MKNIYVLVFALLLCLIGQESKAQDFVFTFVNPAFGGNPYNYSWLLNQADKQNKYDDEDNEEEDQDFSNDPLSNFQSNLGYSIISSLTNKINEDVFGANKDITPGNYEVGTYNIRITKKSSGLNISITDQLTGNSTNMLIPNTAQSSNN